MEVARRGAGDPADKAKMSEDFSFDRLLRRTSGARGEPRPAGGCLDAEMLAAWADGSLTATERAAAETHAADCDRCLAVLAAIATTAPPPSVSPGSKWFSVRWLVPVTTAAVAVTAWMIVGGPQDLPPRSEPAAVDAVTVAESDQLQKADERKKDSDPLRQGYGGQAAPLQDKPAAPPALARSRDQLQARRSAESARKESAAPAQKSTAKAQPPAELNKARAAASAASDASAPAPPAAQRKAEDARLGSLAESVQAPRVIVSPEASSQWRFAASVERSTDGGRSWRTQPTGSSVELLAGSSPSATVCWIVGRAGTVLLSTDGEAWRRLDFRDATLDLVGVTARDAVTATVTAANGRTYRTADAGRTWTLQENPATPF
jgi:hypothetical protein